MIPRPSITSVARQGRHEERQPQVVGPGADAVSDATVVVVDDDPTIRKTLQLYFESASLRAESFATAEDFLKTFDPSRPGCVVLDMGLPGMGGLGLLDQLKARRVTTPIIVFSGNEDTVLAARSIKAGARDFCAKSRGPEVLLACVHEAIGADRRKRQEFYHRHEILARISKLTPREREVLALLAEGQRNWQVAEQLGISARTVASHRASIMRKTQSDSAASLFRQWQIIKDT